MSNYKKNFVDKFSIESPFLLSFCSDYSSLEELLSDNGFEDENDLLEDFGIYIDCEEGLEKSLLMKSLIYEYFILFKEDEIKFSVFNKDCSSFVLSNKDGFKNCEIEYLGDDEFCICLNNF